MACPAPKAVLLGPVFTDPGPLQSSGPLSLTTDVDYPAGVQPGDRVWVVAAYLHSQISGNDVAINDEAAAFAASPTFANNSIAGEGGSNYFLRSANAIYDSSFGSAANVTFSRTGGTMRDIIAFTVAVRPADASMMVDADTFNNTVESRHGGRADNGPNSFAQIQLRRSGNQGLVTLCTGDCRFVLYVSRVIKGNADPATLTHPFVDDGGFHVGGGFGGTESWFRVMHEHRVFGTFEDTPPPSDSLDEFLTWSWSTPVAFARANLIHDNYEAWPHGFGNCDVLQSTLELQPRGRIDIRALPFELREDMLQTEPRSMGRRLR
jgi:hypothetical protein